MVERLLDKINGPADVKAMPVESLPRLATEIRDEIVQVVAKNGGHLGSNLGVIELTIALHYVFDFADDRVLWDVSHQTYTHKLLTDRRDRFHTLRKQGGLSGFSARHESKYDALTCGHAGTAVSTALGILCGDELQGRKRRVVAVIGDGALTCGMTFEAINQCGALKKNLIVVLNDNKMSIGATVGAVANYLNRVRMAPLYHEIKDELHNVLDKVPIVGRSMEKVIEHIRASLKAGIGGLLFEDLGFHHYGPIDGHNIQLLIETLRAARRIKGPVLLHVVTEKGRSHDGALSDPFRMHGVGPVHVHDGKIDAGEAISPPMYTEVFARTLVSMARTDPRIAGITAAMPDGTGLVLFEKEFPTRYFDVGICEQHAIGLAAGLATAGLRPVAAIYSTFLQRAFDQVCQELCLQPVPVILAIDRAGVVGADGPTHHGLFDIAYLRALPNMSIAAPRDGEMLESMMRWALRMETPVAIRYPRTEVPGKAEVICKEVASEALATGKAEMLVKGPDGAIIALGSMVYPGLRAVTRLASEGVRLTLVDARFAKPVDTELFARLCKELPFVITVEEHALAGGFGSAVAEAVRGAGGDTSKLYALGVPDAFVEHGPRAVLLRKLGLDTEGIARAALVCAGGRTDPVSLRELSRL
ncbi:MAG: 1-deoxy-D-xylulose-5-phosphate synthase [Planctomycetota bacterium]|nr:1-deoxy-D-xylulose-5-phosphate synthase [Planctomycetota bacterium]